MEKRNSTPEPRLHIFFLIFHWCRRGPQRPASDSVSWHELLILRLRLAGPLSYLGVLVFCLILKNWPRRWTSSRPFPQSSGQSERAEDVGRNRIPRAPLAIVRRVL